MTALQQDRVTISLLWAFVAIDIAYADILSLYVPGVMAQVLEGEVEGVVLSGGLMLVGAAFLQVPLLAMVLTQVLPPKALRAVNLAAVGVTAAFVVGGGSPKAHYVLVALAELAAMAAIARLAWRAPRRAWEGGPP